MWIDSKNSKKDGGMTKTTKTQLLGITVLFFSFILLSTPSHAELGSGAFNNETMDIKALGKGQTSCATADTPAAVAGNPAGLTQLKGTYATIGASIIDLRTNYTNTSGSISQKMNRDYITVPDMFFVTDLSFLKKLRFAIGMTSPYGLMTEWKNDTFSKYVATQSSYEYINYNPTLAYELCETVSIAAGVDIIDSNIEKRKMFNVAAINASLGGGTGTEPDADVRFRGSDLSYGYNLGILIKPNKKHSFGLTYRDRVKFSYDLNIDISGLSGLSETVFEGTNYSTKGTCEVTLPSSFTTGYAYKPTEKWVFEVNVQWTQWELIKEDFIDFYLERNATRLALLNTGNPIPKDWHNTISAGTGLQYTLNKNIALRTGYYFYQTPIPVNGFDTALPDSNRHYVTAGVGFTFGNWILDTGYSLGFFEKRSIENTVGSTSNASINGTYKSKVHVIGAAQITYKFA